MAIKAEMEAAMELMKARRFDEAKKGFEALLEKHPDSAPAYLGMGNIYAAMGEHDEALEYYEGALHIDKQQPAAYMMMGITYSAKGLNDKAAEKFKEALRIRPELKQASLMLARLYAKTGRLDEAIQSLKEALKYFPQFEDARFLLAGIYQQQGEMDAALKELESIVSTNEAHWQAYLQIARIKEDQGDMKQAAACGEKAVSLNPSNSHAHFALGELYLKMKEYDFALREFNTVSDLDADMPLARIGLAQVYIATGRLAEAKKLLIDLAGGNRHLAVVHRHLATIFLREERFEEALAEYGAAILHGKDLTEKYPELAAIQQQGGEPRAMAEAFEQAFETINLDQQLASEPENPAPGGGGPRSGPMSFGPPPGERRA